MHVNGGERASSAILEAHQLDHTDQMLDRFIRKQKFLQLDRKDSIFLRSESLSYRNPAFSILRRLGSHV